MDDFDKMYSAKMDDFRHDRYTPDGPTYKLPLLVLAATAHRNEKGDFLRLRFKGRRKFHPVCHQTAGHGCHHHHLWATVLTPRTKGVSRAIRELDERWFESDAGMGSSNSLDAVNEYRESLGDLLGVDCNWVHSMFEEAFYPIDLTDENLAKLAKDKLPPVGQLDSLVRWPKANKGTLAFFLNSASWGLYVLGRNCD
jgi:hypothetical protein